MAETRPLESLVRALYDMRLALVALATVVEVVRSGSALTVVALLAALPLSYLPLRRWARPGPRTATLSWLLLDAAAAAALTVMVSDPQLMLLYSVATALLGGLVGGRAGALLVTSVLLEFLVGSVILAASAGEVTPGAIAVAGAFAALYVLCAVGSLRVTTLLTGYDRAVEAARAASRQAAQAEERSRLAREMHDSLSKTISGTHLMAVAVSKRLAAAPDHDAQGPLRTDVERLVTACDIASRDARRLLHGLRDDGARSAVTSISRRVEEVVLEWQTRTALRARVAVETPPGEDDLPSELVYEAACVVAEALENAHRHGGAGAVEVRLSPRDGWLDLSVSDDGRGFDVPDDLASLGRAGHYGVIGMRERAQRVGGTLAVARNGGGRTGTTVRLALPAPALHAPNNAGDVVAS